MDLRNNSYPAPNRYEDPDWIKDMELCGRAPWFDRATLLSHPDFLDSYVTDGQLPATSP